MMDTPPRRLMRMVMNLTLALEEVEELLTLTHEINNLNLQQEGAWFKHHIDELITRGKALLPTAGKPGRGKAPSWINRTRKT